MLTLLLVRRLWLETRVVLLALKKKLRTLCSKSFPHSGATRGEYRRLKAESFSCILGTEPH